jgi:hypothetical protein
MSNSNVIHNALLFIPDISGFTQFINDTQVQHNHRIVAELLEVLIESNRLNLTVNEIEGDAILFYRLGNPPTPGEIIEQSKNMYIAFHRHLKKYGVSRVCNCAACNSAGRLTLKTVAHYGSMSLQKIQNREKLFGTDVIKVHRLLKNDVPDREYILITESLAGQNVDHPETESWLSWNKGSGIYDVGEINYSYTSLEPFYSQVPEPEVPHARAYKSKSPATFTIEINAPVNLVYDALIDLGQRTQWMTGLKAVKIRDEPLNHMNKICTSFECSLEHEKCTFQTTSVEFSDRRAKLSETLVEHPITFTYEVTEEGARTKLTLECHEGFSFPMKWVFNLFMKKKFNSDALKSIIRLKDYCEQKGKI